MFLLSAVAALLLAVSPPPEPVLSAQQYMQVEEIYRKVVDQCCLRKDAARKVHLEIEQMVAAGEPADKIVKLVVAHFNPGLTRRQPEKPAFSPLTSILAAVGGGVFAAALFFAHRAENKAK